MRDPLAVPGINWSNVLFVGMGNRIKSDDGVGIYIAEQLKDKGLQNVIIAENSIENYLGKINNHPSDTLVIIDAVDLNQPAGYYELLPISKIINTTSNTHNLSLDTISSFLDASEQWVLGIQPGDVAFGMEMSADMFQIADQVVEGILGKSGIK